MGQLPSFRCSCLPEAMHRAASSQGCQKLNDIWFYLKSQFPDSVFTPEVFAFTSNSYPPLPLGEAARSLAAADIARASPSKE